MIELSEIIVALWFLPVTAFIIVLLGGVLGLLYSLLLVFKPIAGQKRKPMRIRSQKRATA